MLWRSFLKQQSTWANDARIWPQKLPRCKQLTDYISSASKTSSVVHINGTSRNPEQIMLRNLWHAFQSKLATNNTETSILVPLYVTVRGSMVDSIATVCSVKGYVIKTAHYATVESAVILDIIKTATKFGKTPVPKTISSLLTDKRIYTQMCSQPTFQMLFRHTRLAHGQSLAYAAADVIMNHIIVKRGFTDSGARFRDNSSRKMAQDAYNLVLNNIAYIVTIQ